MYIEKINGPEDVKKLNIEEMTALAEEMRHALLKRASIHGGHFVLWGLKNIMQCNDCLYHAKIRAKMPAVNT